jgi:hypothetical protein
MDRRYPVRLSGLWVAVTATAAIAATGPSGGIAPGVSTAEPTGRGST